MTAKFNFDFTGATVTPTTDSDGKPIKYTITPVQGAGVPAKVEIDINQGTAKCKFDAYYYQNDINWATGQPKIYSPDLDASPPYNNESTDYGCNNSNNSNNSSYAFSNIFSSRENGFGNLQNKSVISKHNSNKNYCEFSVNMNDGEDCNSLNYCYRDYANFFTGDYCDTRFFQNSDHSKISSTNGATLIPIGAVTSINITCPSSLPIPYSYSGFIPTFNSTSRKLTFTLSPGITGTQSLGGTDPNSVPTTISNIDKWNGDFNMNFVCNNGKLFTSWGDMNFEGCGVNL